VYYYKAVCVYAEPDSQTGQEYSAVAATEHQSSTSRSSKNLAGVNLIRSHGFIIQDQYISKKKITTRLRRHEAEWERPQPPLEWDKCQAWETVLAVVDAVVPVGW
jgi:hypothetical protein